VLAGAVVLEPRRLGTALEVVFRRPCLRKQAPHGVDLIRTMEVRRAGDGDLGLVEIRSRPNHGQRLERFRRAPKVGDERGVAAGVDDRPAGDSDRVNVVPGLDHAAPGNLDDYRSHGGQG